MSDYHYDICVVGGAGHVGLPLALAFAAAGQRVLIQDVNVEVMEEIKRGTMPFIEDGADPLLQEALRANRLFFSARAQDLSAARHVIVAIGTPVDEYLHPTLRALPELFTGLQPLLHPDQTIIIRSTVYPGTCRQIARMLERGGPQWKVAYCPERIAQGFAVRELRELPQIVSGTSAAAADAAARLFALIAPEIICVDVEEAELAKLFSNAWRYIQFGAANQFFMIAASLGADFTRIRDAMTRGYGRAASLPGPGFAAGPCLLKDTMQLLAFSGNNFPLGHAAMLVNEGLPAFIVDALRRSHDLSRTRVGILGMAFKADIDDTRDSLSFKLAKILRFHGAEVRCSDEHATDPSFVDKDELVRWAQVVIVGVPHAEYRMLAVPPEVDVYDMWRVLPAQVLVS
ncbi:MAG: nucleotide sugar dehydrogenase [Alphaproteobacteria bacterium]|nr:nucleotide sugar dehydrogenase [Alphaproteobacteria bacterium]MBM3820410.1 nucleotide sugar dehydrogenase [Acidimicrobiia bacterium]